MPEEKKPRPQCRFEGKLRSGSKEYYWCYLFYAQIEDLPIHQGDCPYRQSSTNDHPDKTSQRIFQLLPAV